MRVSATTIYASEALFAYTILGYGLTTELSAIRVSVLSTPGIWVCARRSTAPWRARVQLRGRPISEKALVVLECNEAFENTELSPWNATAHLPGPRVRREPRETGMGP